MKKIPGNATEAEAYMKDKFKNLFSIPQKQTEIFDIIWANDNLRTSLFGNIPLDQLDDFYDAKKVIFDNWINTMDNNIFKFIPKFLK